MSNSRESPSPIQFLYGARQSSEIMSSDLSLPWDSDEKLDANDSINVIAKEQVYLDQATLMLESILKKKFRDDRPDITPRRFGLYRKEFHNITDKTLPMSILNGLASSMPCWYQVEKSKRDSKFTSSIELNLNWTLRYGALMDLNRFVYPMKQSWSNEYDSSIKVEICKRLGAKEVIQWSIRRSGNLSEHILKLSNIEAWAVITKRTDGFSIYIFQKCNAEQFLPDLFKSDRPERSNRGQLSSNNRKKKYERRDSAHSRDTVRFIEKMGTYFPNIEFTVQKNSNRNGQQRDELIQLYNSLTHALYLSRISVFYGDITSEVENHVNEDRLKYYTFPSFLKNYAWEMLITSGYRFKVLASDKLLDKMKEISEKFKEQDQSFYRICLYLFQILKMKPFSDIFQEITYAVDKNEREQVGLEINQYNGIESTDPDWAYVGAVLITLTTTQVKPLRLCETNRVLRAEENGKKLFGKSWESFALVEFRDEDGTLLARRDISHFHDQMNNIMKLGFSLGGQKRMYAYLHHSQSQLRQQQFWFYHHEERGSNKNISFEDAYKWMGKFHDQNAAKYAARMAQCFTSTKKCVTITKDRVETIPDIKTPNGRLIFTDGCGRMSRNLQQTIKNHLKTDIDFSVIQIRYGGAKGVLSVDTRLNSTIDICLRPSMIKFISDFDAVEVCQYSRPMPVYLNRQVIFLLSNRGIHDNIFTICQQRDLLRLIEILTNNSLAVKVLADILPGCFHFKKIQNRNIDFIHELFFRQILIDHCLKVVNSLLQKTRIRVRPSEGRYMFGIADEYDVLEEGEVFIQFTHLFEEVEHSSMKPTSTTILDNCLVVITKNPCHHPGDVRTFTARDRVQLRHLKDVVVFSTKGARPAPHDISGSDLDGDEYTVIWDTELVPFSTKNFEPHNFDANTPNRDHDGEITRETVVERILDNMQNSCLGTLSNIHLAFADQYGIHSTDKIAPANLSTIDLARSISLEVDSSKTGYHPVSKEKLRLLNESLKKKRPDYLQKDPSMSYESSHIIGQLYRALKRTVPIWNRLVQYHRQLGYLEIKLNDKISSDQIKISRFVPRSNFSDHYVQEIYALVDDVKKKPNCHEFVKELLDFYRQEVIEILTLHRLSHENELWSSTDGAKQVNAELEGNAYQQFQALVNRVKSKVFLYTKQFCQASCENNSSNISCDDCKRIQRLIALISYNLSYNYAKKHTEFGHILSFPWIFAEALLSNHVYRVPHWHLKPLCSGMKYTWQHFMKTHTSLSLSSNQLTVLCVDKIYDTFEGDKALCLFIEIIISFVESMKTKKMENILGLFVLQQNGKNGFDTNSGNFRLALKRDAARENEYLKLVNSVKWHEEENNKFAEYFHNILEICFCQAKFADGSEILAISERILLNFQKIVVGEAMDE